jgi:hypothetical protein
MIMLLFSEGSWRYAFAGGEATGKSDATRSSVTLNLFQGPFSGRAAWISTMDAEPSSA